jgi:hypothetical protein
LYSGYGFASDCDDIICNKLCFYIEVANRYLSSWDISDLVILVIMVSSIACKKQPKRTGKQQIQAQPKQLAKQQSLKLA